MSLTRLLDTAWGYVEKGVDYVTGSGTAEHPLYGSYKTDSLYDDVSGFLSTSYDKVEGFLGSKAGSETAGFVGKALFGESGVPKAGTPSARRVSAPRTSGVGSTYQASSVDLGMTSRVMNAARVAQNARAGSSVGSTVQRLQTRPSRGPLLQIQQPAIKVRSRA